MASSKPSNDGKKAGGYIKEKFTIGMSRLTNDEVQESIMKVTSHKLKIPNEKYMIKLLAATYNDRDKHHDDINGYIVVELEKRLHSHDWVVVLKTLLTLHRLIYDASVDCMAAICERRSLFCVANIKDLADTVDGARQKRFILQYARYLEERCYAYERIGIQHKLESEDFRHEAYKRKPADMLSITNSLFLLADSLLAVDFIEEESANNFATYQAFTNLIMDAKRIDGLLMSQLLWAVQRFEDMTVQHMEQWMKYILQLEKVGKEMNLMFQAAFKNNKYPGDKPTVKTLPSDVVASMHEILVMKQEGLPSVEQVLSSSSQQGSQPHEAHQAPSGNSREAPARRGSGGEIAHPPSSTHRQHSPSVTPAAAPPAVDVTEASKFSREESDLLGSPAGANNAKRKEFVKRELSNLFGEEDYVSGGHAGHDHGMFADRGGPALRQPVFQPHQFYQQQLMSERQANPDFFGQEAAQHFQPQFSDDPFADIGAAPSSASNKVDLFADTGFGQQGKQGRTGAGHPNFSTYAEAGQQQQQPQLQQQQQHGQQFQYQRQAGHTSPPQQQPEFDPFTYTPPQQQYPQTQEQQPAKTEVHDFFAPTQQQQKQQQPGMQGQASGHRGNSPPPPGRVW